VKHTHKILGYTRKGTPVFAIAGGSGTNAPPVGDDAPKPGDTITVEAGDRAPAPTEEPPATPASTRSVDPGAFGRGVEEQHAVGQPQQQPAGQKQPTWEDVERARQEEKDKLYGEISSVKDELKSIREAREAEERTRAEEEARAEEQARSAAEGEMDVRELIQQKEREWNERFDQVRTEAERAQALLEQERRFNALQEYKRAQLETHANDIMPHLHGYVEGNTEEEIQASIQRQIETTNAILADVQQAQQAQRASIPGPRVTAPGDGGPVDQQETATRTFSADDIAKMTPAEFAKYRDQLLGAAARQGPYA
jgi:hypothetical protein